MQKLIYIFLMMLISQILTTCKVTNKNSNNNEIECLNIPPDNIGKKVEFNFLVKDIKLKALHIDFIDNSYGYFNSLIVKVEAPLLWSNYTFEMYYQGVPKFNGKILKIGERFKFIEVVPDCLDSEWLFLRK